MIERRSQASQRAGVDDLGQVAHDLAILSHNVRARVIAALRRGRASFTKLLEHVGLDPLRQCGLLDYHLQYLLRMDVITRVKGGYVLTENGMRISSFLGALTHLSEDADMEKEVVDMSRKTGDLVVKKLSEKDVEGFLDFYIARWELDPKYREAERGHILKWLEDKGALHFVAWRGKKIVGWLYGKITSLSFGPSVAQQIGEQGLIDDIVVEKGDDGMEDQMARERIAGALVDAYEEHLSSRFKCVGMRVTRIVPETMPYHPDIFRLLQKKGYLVTNISHEMEKQFPGKLGTLLEART